MRSVVGELGCLHRVVLRVRTLHPYGVEDWAADKRKERVEAVGAERSGGAPDRLGGDEVSVATELPWLAAVLARARVEADDKARICYVDGRWAWRI